MEEDVKAKQSEKAKTHKLFDYYRQDVVGKNDLSY